MALRGRSMKQRRGDRNVTWREAMDVPWLALSRSQPPRRAAPRCFASRHDGAIRNLKLKSCVDSHAFRDEGRFRLHTYGYVDKGVPFGFLVLHISRFHLLFPA